MNLPQIVERNIGLRRNMKPQFFNGELIDRTTIERILNVANWAPTHKGTEPWRFIVFEHEKVKEFSKRHAELYKKFTASENFSENKYHSILHKADAASHVIVVYVNKTEHAIPPLQEEIASVACAVQNMLLMATALDVAVYWGSGGMCYHPAFKEHLHIEEKNVVMGFVFLGKVDEDKKIPGRRKTEIDSKVQWI
ncbi:MAG: nitroreductase [Chitinophagales bacterium]|nr:nitroreductase [Chitinophagales bacterium]